MELMDSWTLKSVNLAEGKKEFDEIPTILFEISGSTNDVIMHELEALKKLCNNHQCVNFEIEHGKDVHKLWKIRKTAFFAAKSLRKDSVDILTTDVAVPISRLAEMLVKTRQDLEKHGLIASIVAHAGDGNFHVLLTCNSKDEREVEACEVCVY